MDIVGVDASEVAVNRARAAATAVGLAVRFAVWDLEADGFPPGPWGSILLLHFLDRRLFGQLADCLAPGGLLACRTHLAHRLRNPGARPRRPEHLLRPGELLSLPGFELLDYREFAGAGDSWAGLLARRTARHSR